MDFPKFFLLDSYFIYMKTSNENYKYTFFKNKDKYYLAIHYKKPIPENYNFFIFPQKNIANQMVCYEFCIKKKRETLIFLGNWETLPWTQCDSEFDLEEIQRKINLEYPSLNYDYYSQQIIPLLIENRANYGSNTNIENSKENNKTILYRDLSSLEKNFLTYHWIFEGSQNKMQLFKYSLYIHKDLIDQLPYCKLKYNPSKNNALIFIDDRVDSLLFECVSRLFLYSVDDSWNLHIYTIPEKQEEYMKVLTLLDVEVKFHIISKINNIDEYSCLLKSSSFWETLTEENLLLYQYDSIAFGKFKSKFFSYNYLGARWTDKITQLPGIYNGNGGTSFRKRSWMLYITQKYNYFLHLPESPEDKYFAYYLYQEGLLPESNELLDEFSVEHVYNETSIYGHAIFQSMNIDQLVDFIKRRFKAMLKEENKKE
jgi:hypothetical protein